VAISAGSFGQRGMAKSMVCTPLCNPSPVYDYHTLKPMYLIAPPPPTKRAASALATPTFSGRIRTQPTMLPTYLRPLWPLMSSAPAHNSSSRNGPRRTSRSKAS